MTKLPDERAREIADMIDAYDQQLADAQEGKRETFQTARIELENLGLDKAVVKAELDGIKLAIRIRQLRRSKPEKLDQEEASEALAIEYLDRIDHSARAPRATRTREERSRARTSEAMADHKELSAELADAGLISREAHAENVRIADAVAEKFGSGSAGQSNSPDGAPDVRSRGGDSPQKNERGIAKHGTQCPPTSGDSMGSTAEPMHEEGSGGLVGSGLLDRPRSVTAGRDRQPAPREALRVGGHIWNNLRDAYGWPEGKIQEWWLSGRETVRPDLHPEGD